MSDCQRWEPLDDSTMRTSPDGGWVLIGDYSCVKREAYILRIECQNLQSENARLKAELTDRKAEADRLKAEVKRLNVEVDILRASSFVTAVSVEQYERVVKAGDAMLGAIKVSDPILDWKIELWNAAKEGKPSV